MTRKECLDKAAECVLKDRASQYGGMEDNFARIAELWNAYLGPHAGIGIESHDVAAMMALLKIARVRSNPGHGDSWIDLAGYAACGAECAGVKQTAKGCEELVQHIRDVNPAIYGGGTEEV